MTSVIMEDSIPKGWALIDDGIQTSPNGYCQRDLTSRAGADPGVDADDGEDAADAGDAPGPPDETGAFQTGSHCKVLLEDIA